MYSDEFMTQTLSREYKRHSRASPPSFLEPELEGQRKLWPPLASLTPPMRLQVLYDLCSFTLFDLETLMTRPNMHDLGPQWRLESVAMDKHGLCYWFLAGRWLFSEASVPSNPKNKKSSSNANPPEEGWKCIAWDSASWQAFLNSNPLTSSRKASDRETLRRFRDEIYPRAEPLLLEEERHQRAAWKKQQAELQRLVFLDSRKRSSRLAAKDKIRADMQIENSPPSRRPKVSNSSSRSLSREERIALRHQKVARLEEQSIEEALEQSARSVDGINVESTDGETFSGLEKYSETDHAMADGEFMAAEHPSPIKLIVRKGPQGDLNAQVFIGDQVVEKNEPEAQLDVNERAGNPVTSSFGTLHETDASVSLNGVHSPETSKIDIASLLTDLASIIQ